MNKIYPNFTFLLVISMLLSCQGGAFGQTLYDVVISLTERQRVIRQGNQVFDYLFNQAHETDYDLSEDNPFDWHGAGANPSQSAIDGLSIGDKVALLNQAVCEFDRLKVGFLNSSDSEFSQNLIVGTLQSYTPADFDPLPRATPQNYHELLRLLAQRVRTLRLISWPATFHDTNWECQSSAYERVVYGDPDEDNEDGDREAGLEIVVNEGVVPSFENWNPNLIETTSPDVKVSYLNPGSYVTRNQSSSIEIDGTYNERNSNVEGIPDLRTKTFKFSANYSKDAQVSDVAPGAEGVQINGTVYILRRSVWHEVDLDSISPEYDKAQAGYVVEASGSSGIVSLFGSPPAVGVNGSWVTTSEDDNGLSQVFRPGGYQQRWTGNYSDSYELNWRIGNTFHSVFKPTFTRGVDAQALRLKFESLDNILADSTADGKLLLHPRPSQLFGIHLGPGLKGAGNGYISCGSIESDWGELHYGEYGRGTLDSPTMPRFDASCSLQFAGSCSDYHVVYDNDRSKRTQKLPADNMGWPYTESDNETHYDVNSLYRSWDSPRLKQVLGRDLIADVTYNIHHYGGYTINIYRRPTGSAAPAPGETIDISDLQPIRSWEFSHPGISTEAHPTDEEELLASGSGGETYEIRANHILPGTIFGGEELSDWLWYTEGNWSWTLKLLQDTTEKVRQDIGITTQVDDEFEYGIVLSESLDGQPVSSLSSTSLDPFSERFPTDWITECAGKTITGSATLDSSAPTHCYGKWPMSVSIQYDGIQPDVDYTWNENGLLALMERGPWTIVGNSAGDTQTLSHKFDNSIYSITSTEFLDGGNKVKTSSTADGSAGSPVARTEVEYGTATSGLPGLPHIVKNSDGSGATYDWDAETDGSYILTFEEGLLSGSSVSRGTKFIRNVNSRGFPTQTESFVRSAKTGGSVSTAPADFTAWGMPKKATDFNTGLASTWDHSGYLSRLSTHTGFLGVVSNFSGYDVLGRPATVSANNITSTNTYTAFSTTATISGGASGSITDTRDALGRLTNGSTTWNGVTDTAIPDRSTAGVLKITGNHTLFGDHRNDFDTGDGSMSLSKGDSRPFGGAGGTNITVEGGLLKTTSRLLDNDGNPTDTFTTTWTDAWGRVRKVSTPPASGSNPVETSIVYKPLDHNASNAEPQRVIVTDKTGRVTITETDPISSSGILRRSGIDVNGNGNLGASDRYVESLTTVSGSNVVTVLSLTEDSGLREILRTTWTPARNITGTKINGNEDTIIRTPNYGTKTIKTESTKGWEKNESFNNLGLTTSSVLSGTGVPAATLTPTWNDDGSLSGVTFTTGGDTHSATFKGDGTLLTLNAPGKGNILGGHSISGGVETLTVDGTTTVQRVDGTLVETSGGDTLGKTEELSIPTTRADFNHATTPVFGAATNVSLNAAGAPTAKTYAAGAGESYMHTPGGLLKEVTLARASGTDTLVFGYSPDGAKDLTTAAWPQVTSGPFTLHAIVQSYGHDRAGRVDEIGDASGARNLIYQSGRLKQTAWNSGQLSGFKVVKGLDTQGRDTGFELWRGNTMIHSAAKTFTGDNSESDEVFSVTATAFSAVYGRSGSRSLESIARGPVTQRWQRGTAGRILLADTNNTVSGAPTSSYTTFDTKGRRKNCITTGGEWIYQYTTVAEDGVTAGQLKSAIHPTLGSFSYQFDSIGRRKNHASSNNYADLLNRTLDWENTGNKTLKIAAHPDARVWLKVGTGSTFEITSFTGSYEHPLPFPSGSGIWQAWDTLAVLEGEGDAGANADAKAQQTGAVWVPPVNETLGYDDAGNRESSALWNFGWNAKNELVRARTKNHNKPSTPQGYDITNACDAEGRRFSKKVNRYQNGSVVEQKVITFLHDGDDVIYERHQLPSGLTICERKYIWGPDISGTHGGAGGAGGLLLIRETKGNSTIDLYPLYDGTGHVVALADNTGTLQAEYAYGPFGELLYARGPNADSCPFRFATKYYDSETGLYNFGKRFFDPVTGQFLSRDPLGESESLNLYSYCGNDPINYVDVNGLAKVALDGKGNLTAIGRIILDIAKGDPNAARSLLMAKQVDAETAGIAVTGDGGEDSIRNVTRAIETAVGNAQEDGRDEWRMIAAKAGLSGERYFGGYKDAWMTAKLAEYAPQIAANAGAAIQLQNAERAVNDKATADQNSAPYKLREFLDAPFDVAAFFISAGAATDVTTGNAVTWNSFNSGGGFNLQEVPPGERAFVTAMVFLPVGRVGGVADDVARVGMRGGGPGGWMIRAEGTQIKQVGNYWVKEVNPDANALMRWWGGGSLNAQAKALNRLGDMAPSHLYKNGKLVMRDAGHYTPGNFWSTWARGSVRLRTPFNDIRTRNIGANGLIFDPAKHPIQQGLEATALGGGLGLGGLYLWGESE